MKHADCENSKSTPLCDYPIKIKTKMDFKNHYWEYCVGDKRTGYMNFSKEPFEKIVADISKSLGQKIIVKSRKQMDGYTGKKHVANIKLGFAKTPKYMIYVWSSKALDGYEDSKQITIVHLSDFDESLKNVNHVLAKNK
jgi:hypothetical protein